MKYHRALRITALSALALGMHTGVFGQARYTLTDLGDLGGSEVRAFGINDSGQIVGTATDSEGHSRAFLWEDGVMTGLGTLGGSKSMALDISPAGLVTGAAENAAGQVTAFLYDGTMHDLGFRVGWNLLMGVNDSGQVTGRDAMTRHAFLYDGELPPLDIPTFGGSYGHGVALTSEGHVVGDSEYAGSNARAFYWDGTLTPLEFLPGGAHAVANDVNEMGQIVGYSFARNTPNHPVLWISKDDLPVDLGTLGGQTGNAVALNNHAQVVGGAETPTGQIHAFIWENGNITDLNELIDPASPLDYLRSCDDINDKGQIVCQAVVGSQLRAFLLTPIAPRLTVRVSAVQLSWNSVSGRDYQIQYRTALGGDEWSDLGEPVRGSGDIESLTDEVEEGQFARFYRVIELAPDLARTNR